MSSFFFVCFSSLSGWSCQTCTHGFHHSYWVPPEESRDHPDLHRLQGARQAPAGFVYPVFIRRFPVVNSCSKNCNRRQESCFYRARSSHRWDRDGLHHWNVWRVPNGENPAVPHARCHLSGRVQTDRTEHSLCQNSPDQVLSLLALFVALSECNVLPFHSCPLIRAVGKVKPCTSTQKEPSDQRDSSLWLRGNSAAQRLWRWRCRSTLPPPALMGKGWSPMKMSPSKRYGDEAVCICGQVWAGRRWRPG